MLNSQALNAERSLGQGLGIMTTLTTSIKMFGSPTIGQKIHAEQELDNAVDKFAEKVVKDNETVGHLPREYSRILWYFIARGRKICVEVTGRRRHCKQLCGGMEIPCRLVFTCSTKAKINRLKELLQSKIGVTAEYPAILKLHL